MRNRLQMLTVLLLMLFPLVQGGLAQEKSFEPAAERPPQLETAQKLPPLQEGTFISSLDQTKQPFVVWAPETATTEPTPLLLFLHSWSGNYRQNNQMWQQQAVERGWIYLHPDFRGPNQTPAACGSALARQDVLDALNHAKQVYQVDPERVYLAGSSGGGHMTMLMIGHHPEKFSAASAWVGISDLAEWYRFHTPQGKPRRYAQMIVSSLGGTPGSSPEVDAQYLERSPIHHLQRAAGMPVDLNAGIHDGYMGSVPIMHTLRAFNKLAIANDATPLEAAAMEALVKQGASREPLPETCLPDAIYGRYLHLRETAGPARVTIFEGGHEGLAEPACHWLSQQQRLTK